MKPAGIAKRLLHTDPNDQVAAAKINKSAPAKLPCKLPPRFNKPMPSNPTATPSHSLAVILCPHIEEKIAIQIGAVAMAKAATLDETVCCT